MRLLLAAVTLFACAHRPEPVDPSLARGALEVGGRTRTFLSWSAGPGAPLVISLHGRLGDGAGQAKLSGLLPLAQRERFTLVLPDGVQRSWHDARGEGPAAEQGVDDVAFLDALLDEFIARGADARRVYLLGMSNGGFMTLTYACRRGDRLAAAASVTGTVSKRLEADCPLPAPVPVALFLGTEDTLVPFAGGQVARNRGEALGADASARFFAHKNGCPEALAAEALPDVDPADGTRVTLHRFAGCPAPVELFVVEGGGHTWPGGWAYLGERLVGRVSRDLDASEAAWRFFQRFSR